MAELFEKVALEISPELAAKWLRRELVRVANYNKKELHELEIDEKSIIDLLKLIENNKIKLNEQGNPLVALPKESRTMMITRTEVTRTAVNGSLDYYDEKKKFWIYQDSSEVTVFKKRMNLPEEEIGGIRLRFLEIFKTLEPENLQ